MARQAPAGLLGIHVNMPPTVPADAAEAVNAGEPAPDGLSTKEKAAHNRHTKSFIRRLTGRLVW